MEDIWIQNKNDVHANGAAKTIKVQNGLDVERITRKVILKAVTVKVADGIKEGVVVLEIYRIYDNKVYLVDGIRHHVAIDKDFCLDDVQVDNNETILQVLWLDVLYRKTKVPEVYKDSFDGIGEVPILTKVRIEVYKVNFLLVDVLITEGN